MIHQNSIKSIRTLKPGGTHNRILQIHHIAGRPLTDREVKQLGKFEDMNEVRPRTTELLSPEYGSRLEEFGSTIDVKTKKEVRKTQLVKQRSLF